MRYLILFILLFITLNMFSQPRISYDSSDVEIKMPDKKAVTELKNNKHFIYNEKMENPTSWKQKLMYWLLDKFYSFFSDEGAAPYIRYVIVALFLIFIIFKIFKKRIGSIFVSSKKRIKIENELLDEDLNKMDLPQLINNAIREKNYQVAVRYLFLQTLKILINTEQINSRVNRTNNELILDLKNTKYLKEFSELVAFYEHGWYGNFNISKENFNRIQKKFDSFINNL